jgi:hypothetical protein
VPASPCTSPPDTALSASASASAGITACGATPSSSNGAAPTDETAVAIAPPLMARATRPSRRRAADRSLLDLLV